MERGTRELLRTVLMTPAWVAVPVSRTSVQRERERDRDNGREGEGEGEEKSVREP